MTTCARINIPRALFNNNKDNIIINNYFARNVRRSSSFERMRDKNLTNN